jgi:hypothetical protein
MNYMCGYYYHHHHHHHYHNHYHYKVNRKVTALNVSTQRLLLLLEKKAWKQNKANS